MGFGTDWSEWEPTMDLRWKVRMKTLQQRFERSRVLPGYGVEEIETQEQWREVERVP